MYPLPNLPCFLPAIPIPDFVDLDALANYFSSAFEVLSESHFLQDALWRDTFAMTGTLRTFYSAKSIAAAWKDTSAIHKPTSFEIQGKPNLIKAGDSHWVELRFTFETRGIPATTADDGILSVALDKDGNWKIWIMRTVIGQLKDQPNVDKLDVVRQLDGEKLTNGTIALTNGITTNGATPNGITTNGTIPNGTTSPNVDFQCIIIGGGQAGLSVGGRLKALGVSYVVVDKYEQVGDSWAKRYDSTRLHTIREFAHLPFERTFPATYQEFLTKDDLAKGFREWAAKFDINVWTSTTVLSGSWISEHNTWELKIRRNGENQTITCSYIVLAVGANSRFPVAPTYENREAFRGVILHSGDYTNSKEWVGKHGVVVGSGNTAHDVADDMYSQGMASVTMVQRNPTSPEEQLLIIPGLYNADTPTELADLMFFTGPAVITRIMAGKMLHAKIRQHPERFDALEKAGFLLDRYADMGYVVYVRQGGHYMDVGTSGKIASGLIKMKTDSLPVRWVEDGLECANGDLLRADVVVFSTGFVGNLRLLVAELLGNDVAAQVEDYWGLNEEGELRGAFKPSGHPAFWYTGGAIGQARYMSRFIALQIKAKCLGTPLPLYTETPPRNSSIPMKVL
ncbi:uncharacterized protein Z519_02861 [Cladophialophora bantiana CBS 173.52]|uniref:FAD/NAD(P)-binding domain-containing protein n=1 Tax=Cladophialophora bantiana (strain ATCC 10958 / CBS 173.52 / CDC B-1940 / NIH 8579) TaxID=1442370 RepID=A0A0D2GB33_CLAB1|nr:uncharacterized protein Z519_02861 [Cladophialophora bantiana CBS 173.52]KIW95797.1 hypothetical protein Z519_02861 [Cladophialophora bantiana CBS 173.52]